MADETPVNPDAAQDPAKALLPAAESTESTISEIKNGSDAPRWLLLVIYGGGAALYAAWKLPATRQFMDQYWQFMIFGLVVLIGVLLALKPAMSTGQKRMALVVFVVVPLVVGLLGAVPLLDPRYQVSVLRAVFIAVVTLLPATMYYLFITTRKYSLLNEFVANLHRLGLLDERADEINMASAGASESAHRLRVVAYMQKFEAAYGSLPPSLMDDIRRAPDISRLLLQPGQARLASSGVADVFTPETTPPLVISTILIGLGWVTMLPPWQGGTVDWHSAFVIQVTQPHYFAFLGAYFFSIQMLFRRYVLRDLRSAAYVAVALRIVLATIATWVLVQIFHASETIQLLVPGVRVDGALLVLAFAAGVFPEVAWQYVQAMIKKWTRADVVVPSLATQLPISDLDGLTVWHQTRLEEEDIENIPNMATASIVDLMLNTRIPPDRIIDWVDQAILYSLIGGEADEVPRRSRLRECGFRTASSLVDAYWNRSTPADIQKATEEKAPIELTVAALLTNPSLRLIQRWRRLPEEPLLRVGIPAGGI